jgi:protein gp37
MGANSRIEWTHHTFNPWWGCFKVSPACKNCCAEAWAKRVGADVWGARAPRRFFGEAHWREPLKWNVEAAAAGRRARVFCASMADVFEDRRDLDAPREHLWRVIEETPGLDWLLLTKRPQNIMHMTPWGERWPANVWVGTTVEKQQYAEERVPALLKIPAACRFLSCEPLLGPLDLARWMPRRRGQSGLFIDWVIAGGESGAAARPMNPDWPRDLRDQCIAHGVAFHFKQWGHWAPMEQGNGHVLRQLVVETKREGPVTLGRYSKKDARLLDGRTWDGIPSVRAA